MSIRFVPLFSLTITHAYYGGRCRDFAYVLPQDAARLLENARMIAKTRDGQLVLLFEADDAGQALVRLPGQTVRIGLTLLNPYFGNVTALAINPAGFAALYGNEANARQLEGPAPAALVGPVFGHRLQDAARPVTVAIRRAAGATLRTETVTATDNRAAVSLDLRGEAPGRLTLEELYPTNVRKTAAYYLDAELREQGVLGVAEVRIDAGFYAAAADLTLAFDAKQDTLKYYLVARNYSNAEFAQLVVKDAGFAEESRPEIKFTKVAAGAFTAAEIPAAVLAGGDAKVVLFKSQTAVARRDGGRKKIQLNRNGDTLIKHLPHPGPDSATADLIVHVSKP